MSSDWDFKIDLRVFDPQMLVEAARAHPDAAGMPTEDFYDDAGEVNIAACLSMLLDPGSLPGCSVYAGVATRWDPS